MCVFWVPGPEARVTFLKRIRRGRENEKTQAALFLGLSPQTTTSNTSLCLWKRLLTLHRCVLLVDRERPHPPHTVLCLVLSCRRLHRGAGTVSGGGNGKGSAGCGVGSSDGPVPCDGLVSTSPRSPSGASSVSVSSGPGRFICESPSAENVFSRFGFRKYSFDTEKREYNLKFF